MATLIMAGMRRCNAACHAAQGPDCVCGGRFHARANDGSLTDAVRETTREFVEYFQGNGADVGPL